MASGALPPGFPAVEIDGEFYWDGGLVSNTPLYYVLTAKPRRDTLIFQIDLWSASGELPTDLLQVAVRQKDIQYSSRTRLVTTTMQEEQNYRRLLHEALAWVPESEKSGGLVPACRAGGLHRTAQRCPSDLSRQAVRELRQGLPVRNADDERALVRPVSPICRKRCGTAIGWTNRVKTNIRYA